MAECRDIRFGMNKKTQSIFSQEEIKRIYQEVMERIHHNTQTTPTHSPNGEIIQIIKE